VGIQRRFFSASGREGKILKGKFKGAAGSVKALIAFFRGRCQIGFVKSLGAKRNRFCFF